MTTDFDFFAIRLLDEAKRFLEKFADDKEEANLHAALVLGFSALESHMNGVADELAVRESASLLDKSLLLERGLKLDKGEWKLGGQQFFRLEDRLAFLFRRYGIATLSGFG